MTNLDPSQKSIKLKAILQIENMISRILSAFSPKNLSNTEILTCELSLIAMLAVRKDIHTIKNSGNFFRPRGSVTEYVSSNNGN